MLLAPQLFKQNNTGKPIFLSSEKTWGQRVCVLPRSKCLFRRVSLSSRNDNARKAMLLRLKSEAMSSEARFDLVSDTKGLGAGAWEYSKGDYYPHKGRVLSESLAREPMDQGVRLVQCIEGFDGQIWEGGSLIASRWWKDMPSQRQWTSFILGLENGTSAENLDLPKAVTVPFRTDLPILRVDPERAVEILSPLNMAKVFALILIMGGVYFGGQFVRNVSALQLTVSEKDSLSDETRQILSQKRRAIGNMKDAQKYDVLGHRGALLFLFGDMSEALMGEGLFLKGVRLRDEQVEIDLRGDTELAVPDIVKKLEQLPSLEDVSISLEARGTIAVKANMAPVSERWMQSLVTEDESKETAGDIK